MPSGKIADVNGSMGNIESLADQLRADFGALAVSMMKMEFTRENYDRLFPDGKVHTPIGEVGIGKNQLAKLESKDLGGRQRLLGAVFQTLTDPVVVARQHREKDGGKESRLYAKSFVRNDGRHYDVVISVAVDQYENREPVSVVITTHRRNEKDVMKAIKNPADILYWKNASRGDSGDPGVNSPSPDGRHSTSTVSPETTEKSSDSRNL